jgi:hypothetical protein
MKPSKGGRTVVAGIGGAISMVLALASAVVAAVFDERIYDRFDLERLGSARFLGALPRERKRRRGAANV